MKTRILASALLLGLSVPYAAFAQSSFETAPSNADIKPAPQTCAMTDLQGSWLSLFETEGNVKAACLFTMLKGGGIRDGVCLLGNAVNSSPMAGKIAVNSDTCQTSGTVNMTNIGRYSFIAHIAADKSTMTGVLLNTKTNVFLPMAVTHWPN